MTVLNFLAMSETQQHRLREVFDVVKSRPNWKDPIRAFVPRTFATEAEISAAVVFFAGGQPEVVEATKDGVAGWAVTGAGYYEWIGA